MSVVLQTILGLGLVVLAVLTVTARRLMSGAVCLAGFSLMLALEFYVLEAPDVAVAEAGIGAGLTTAILVLAIWATRKGGARK